MMYMEYGIRMATTLDQGQGGGLFGKLLGAGKRLVTGESLFTTVYTNGATGKRRVAFAAPYPGKILPIDLRVSYTWGQLASAAQHRGRPRPVNDMWIAAVSLAHGIPLATRNVKDYTDFAQHHGLVLRSY